MQIYTIANKTMIGIFDGKTASGFFSQSDSLIKVTLSIVTSLGVVMLPHVSNLFSKGKIKEVQETLKKSFFLMTGLAIPIMFGVMGIALNFAGSCFGALHPMAISAATGRHRANFFIVSGGDVAGVICVLIRFHG